MGASLAHAKQDEMGQRKGPIGAEKAQRDRTSQRDPISPPARQDRKWSISAGGGDYKLVEREPHQMVPIHFAGVLRVSSHANDMVISFDIVICEISSAA